MDNSKKYIKMCEKGYEMLLVLSTKKLRAGSIIMFRDDKSPRMVLNETEINYSEKLYHYTVINLKTGTIYGTNHILEDGFIVWQQDQLQEILNGYFGSNARTIWFFNDWVTRQSISIQRNNSYEQLRLAFVMEKKYNKKWNGEDWI